MNIGALLRAVPGKLYVQIADLMRSRIQSGEWSPGAQIPALDALAAEFDVALVTVRQAVALLEAEDLLTRRHGRGTFVTERSPQKQIWLKMESSWNALVKKWQGTRPSILKVADDVPAPLDPADGKPARSYHYMRRVHIAEGLPYTIVDIYLDGELYARAPKRFDMERIMPVLASLPGVSIPSARETLSISVAGVETARLLKVQINSPVGVVRRVVQDQRGVVVFMAEVIYRGDVVKLERTFVR